MAPLGGGRPGQELSDPQPRPGGGLAIDVAFRQHPYGHTPNPNWSYFIAFAAKEFAEQK